MIGGWQDVLSRDKEGRRKEKLRCEGVRVRVFPNAGRSDVMGRCGQCPSAVCSGSGMGHDGILQLGRKESLPFLS